MVFLTWERTPSLDPETCIVSLDCFLLCRIWLRVLCDNLLCGLSRWAQLWSSWSWASPALHPIGDLRISCPLFVPMGVEVWEGGFEIRVCKCMQRYLICLMQSTYCFLDSESFFLTWLWFCFMILYLRCTLWPLLEVSQPLVQHPGDFRESWYIYVTDLKPGKERAEAWRQQKSAIVFICSC